MQVLEGGITSRRRRSVRPHARRLGSLRRRGHLQGFDLTRFRKKYGDLDHYPWAFENLLERLNERLLERGEYAVVIADEQHAYKDELQRQVMLGRQRAPYGGYRAQQLTQVLDTAHFVDSKLSRLTQLADMVAFVVRRRACAEGS